MLVDDAGRFVTLRTLPALARVRVDLVDGGYRVLLPNGEVCDVPERSGAGPHTSVQVWDHEAEAEVVEDASRAFRRAFSTPLRLVRQLASSPRALPPRAGEGCVSFADAYPLLLVAEASVADLSARVGAPMAMARFRPNLVVAGLGAYDEDRLASFRVGDHPLRGLKGCTRCVATTVDPDGGSTGPEPLRTLAGYRREAGQVWFGMNVVHASRGAVQVGDPVSVESWHDVPPRA